MYRVPGLDLEAGHVLRVYLSCRWLTAGQDSEQMLLPRNPAGDQQPQTPPGALHSARLLGLQSLPCTACTHPVPTGQPAQPCSLHSDIPLTTTFHMPLGSRLSTQGLWEAGPSCIQWFSSHHLGNADGSSKELLLSESFEGVWT